MSSHPAFPVIVALWFSALLAIGSVVLPLSLFENLAVASGLADSFAVAQPPFGSAARIALAIVAAVIGALAGIFVARKVAAAQTRGSAARRAKPPISAHDELGEGGLDAEDEGEFHERRRALAVTGEEARDEPAAGAPLPGQNFDSGEEPLDLMAFEMPVIEDAAGFEVVHEPAHDFAQAEPGPESVAIARKPEPELAASVAARPLGELGIVELVERFAIALQRHRESAEESRAAEAENADRFEERPLPVALQPFGFDEPPSDEADDDEALPDFDFAAEQEAVEARGEPEFDAFEEDFEETAEAGYTSLLAMKNPYGQVREPVRIDTFDEHDEVDEPVVAFPAQAARLAAPASHRPGEPAETERALRDALERLQKLSGAA